MTDIAEQNQQARAVLKTWLFEDDHHAQLERARETRAVGGAVDLTPLKDYVASLPDLIEATPENYQALDRASAIAFHLRMAFSFEFSSRRIESLAKSRPSTDNLTLEDLDL
jgi:hypothetical protein